MTTSNFYSRISDTLTQIETDGLTKPERVLTTPQAPVIQTEQRGQQDLINLCANNYLGLGNDPRVIAAGKEAMDTWGAGLASVRFICGTQTLHKQLERELADWLGYEDSILFAACFDANGAVFEPLFGPDDAIISDSLNHASIIDGIRLCKARRYRFATSDMDDLEAKLTEAKAGGAESMIIVTDGVFSMDGTIAKLDEIAELAAKFGALIMVDDCHATGFIGPEGRGTPALHGVTDKVDILTGTLGKALGGAMGGYICARQSVVDLLRQKARPYLFSNTLAPAIAGAGLAGVRLARAGEGLRASIQANAAQFRAGLTTAGFTLLPGEHPIIPVMIGDAAKAQEMSERLLVHGVYAIGFSFPVVPKGQARIRTQVSAAHTSEQIARAILAFIKAGQDVGII